jgi:hypothetical protein
MDPAMLVLAMGGGATAGVAIATLVVGGVVGLFVDRWLSAKSLRAAQDQGRDIIRNAEAEAKNAAEKLRLDAEKETLQRKEKLDAEVEASRAELRETERRLGKREDVLHDSKIIEDAEDPRPRRRPVRSRSWRSSATPPSTPPSPRSARSRSPPTT